MVNVHNPRGATLLEVAVTTPIFLGIIFFLLWLIEVENVRYALSYGTVSGVRLAVARFSEANDEIGVDLRDSSLFTANLPPGSLPDAHEQFYEASFSRAYGADFSFNTIPPLHRAALAYITQSLRQSLGNNFRMPCAPTDNDSGAGCVDCQFLNPQTWTLEGPDQEITNVTESIGIECRYRYTPTFLQPLANMFALLGVSDGALPLIDTTRRAIMFVPDSRFVVCSQELNWQANCAPPPQNPGD